MKNYLIDCVTMTKRNLKISLRNMDVLIMSLVMPAMMMIIFVYLFGGALDIDGKFGGISYVNYIVAAVIILSIGQTAASSSVAVNSDLKEGITDRFISLPIAPSTILVGQVAANVIRNIASTMIVFGVALLIGFRSEASITDWLLVALVLIAFMFVMAWLAVLFGLITKTPEGASTILIPVMLIPYLSSGFVPTNTMPTFLRVIAEHQPMTPVIETIRSLLLDLDSAMWLETIIWTSALLITLSCLSVWLFRRRTQ